MSNDLVKHEDNQQLQRVDATMQFHAQWSKWEQVATTVYKSGMLNPTVWKSPASVMMGFMACHELGIPVMSGIMGMYVVNGKVSMEVTLQNAVIQRSGERTEMRIEDGEGFCRIYMKRKDGVEYTAMFTRQDAQKAGLLNKDNWKNWEKDMLRSRAFAIGNRVLFTHVLKGMHYTPEELGAQVTVDNGEEVILEQAFDEQSEFDRINKTLIDLCKNKPTLESLQIFYDVNKADILKMSDPKMSVIMTTYNRAIKPFGEQYVITRNSLKDTTEGTATTTEPAENGSKTGISDATIIE